jgi:hypothetical protein
MRALVVVALLGGSASADRETIVTLGGALDVREQLGDGPPRPSIVTGGARLMLSWDRPFVAQPKAVSARLVPELFVSFLTDETHAVGDLGAGLRGELQVTTEEPEYWRVAFYAFARGFVFGKARDPAGEFGIGDYILVGHHGMRFGFDGGMVVRHDSSGNPPEVLVHCYVGWVL